MKTKLQSLSVASLLIVSFAFMAFGLSTEAQRLASRSFATNENFINALQLKIDLSNPRDVFRYVIGNLPDEVTIYPTENHYYFEFSAQGQTVKGNIEISAARRDKGEIIFAYDEVNAFPDAPNVVSGAVVLSAREGVEVRRVTPFRYELVFQGKTVAFKLNQLEQKLPARIRLAPDEIFVGHIFDESGLKFFLVNNEKLHHLFWLLDDEDNMPETLTLINDEILVGNRSAFAFYDDQINGRRILIGVSDNELQKNSWYDGPFDQLPDNYIASGQVQVKKYMEAAYPYSKGNIDNFGIFLDDPEGRLAITSYRFYAKVEELTHLISSAKQSSRDKSEFYRLITADRQP